MRGKKAKRIRREVYGDRSIRHREYYAVIPHNRYKSENLVCAADEFRYTYQQAKGRRPLFLSGGSK